MSFVLRPERTDDEDHLAALLCAVDTSWGTTPFRVAVRDGGIAAAKLVILRPQLDSVVAESNGAVVGYGALRQQDDAVMIVNMLVAPDHQGNGIGRAIVTELCRRMAGDVRHVHLDVLLESHAARHLYHSLGFREFDPTSGKLSGREGRLMCLAPQGAHVCIPVSHEATGQALL